MASSASQFTETPNGGPNTTSAAYEQNSLACAAVIAGRGQMGMHAPHAQVQMLSMPYRSCCCCTQEMGSTTFSNLPGSGLKLALPPSVEYARQVDGRLRAATPLPACQFPTGASPTSAEVVGEAKDRDLDALAKWLRLDDLTLPSPLVGDVDSDPDGVADRYGVKGLSPLTAFVNMVDFSCRVCAFKARTLPLAVLHQQQKRHFQL